MVASANTFEAVAREWVERQGRDWSDSHRQHIKGRLENDLFPLLGKRPIAEIKAPELLACLRRIEERAPYTALRVRSTAGQVFRYAIATTRGEHDPSAALKGALTNHDRQHFASITEPAEVGRLLRALWGYQNGAATVRTLLKLTPYLFARPGELRAMQWADLDLNGPEPVWRYYPAKANGGKSAATGQARKQKSVHFVPLARQAVELLAELHPLTGHGALVFPGERKGRGLSENTLNAALRALGFEMTGHGFPHMASTLLNGHWLQPGSRRAPAVP